MKYRLERTFGPGLRDLHDEHGNVITERLNWANKIYRKVGGSRTIQFGSLSFDAGDNNAFWLGFVQGMNFSLKTDE